MKTYRGLSKAVILSLFVGALGTLFIAVSPACAQTSKVSTFTIQVSGIASALKTGLGEAVTFSGPVVVTTAVMTDPVRPPIVFVTIDGRGVKGIGRKTGITYLNECEANLHRRFAATDVINTTFAFFEDEPGSYLTSKTGLLTLHLTYNTTTLALTRVTANVGSL
jgi:hypothetical protein